MWQAALDVPAAQAHALTEVLSADEWERAHRFVIERDRRRFIVCRGVLRSILGRYLGAVPSSLRFRYSPHGKPALSSVSGEHPLRFSVSHAEDTALYGVTLQRGIGVDIESVRAEFAGDDIAERVFSRREILALRTLSPADRPQAFFRCWTRKEAYIKARGEGFSLPLSRFDVSIFPDEPAALLSVSDDPQETARWSLRDLPAGPGYVAAIAVEGQDWLLRCWRWAGTNRREAGA